MPTTELWIQSTHYNDGSADFTLSVDGEDHLFSVTPEGSNGVVSYEETLSERWKVRVKNPPEDVWRSLIQSDEMTEYLESHDNLTGVRRERR